MVYNRPNEEEVNRMKTRGFYRGVNLGGWLSQCDYSAGRINGFITEKDINTIASWGLDHVRIPVDHNVLEDKNGALDGPGFAALDRALSWCGKRGLKAVIDLHKTAGFSFDPGECEAGFFENEAYQARFYRLWQVVARRFGGRADVAFELLNEVTDQSYIGSWNRISRECIRAIRLIDPKVLILVGSYHNNSAAAVPALDPPADENTAYNFHCYDPLPFTHQGAPWVPSLDKSARPSFDSMDLPEDYFETRFAPALEAARKYGSPLYCGEYGVIDRARPEEALKWFSRIHAAFEKFEIARAAWSYKQMDFGLSDARLDGVRDELIRLL